MGDSLTNPTDLTIGEHIIVPHADTKKLTRVEFVGWNANKNLVKGVVYQECSLHGSVFARSYIASYPAWDRPSRETSKEPDVLVVLS